MTTEVSSAIAQLLAIAKLTHAFRQPFADLSQQTRQHVHCVPAAPHTEDTEQGMAVCWREDGWEAEDKHTGSISVGMVSIFGRSLRW